MHAKKMLLLVYNWLVKKTRERFDYLSTCKLQSLTLATVRLFWFVFDQKRSIYVLLSCLTMFTAKKHSYSQNKHKRWKRKHSSYHYLCHNKRDIQAKLPIQPQYQRLRKELHFLDELKTFSYSREANESARSMQIKAKADKNKSSTRRSELYQKYMNIQVVLHGRW